MYTISVVAVAALTGGGFHASANFSFIHKGGVLGGAYYFQDVGGPVDQIVGDRGVGDRGVGS